MFKQTSIKNTNFCLLLIMSCLISHINAKEITVAVAANFHSTLKVLKQAFELQSQHRITIVSGSTGKLYIQIVNGAPFDIFMSADLQTPKLLEEKGIAIKGSRMTYAIGRLALWSADATRVDSEGKVLSSDSFDKIAIANPKLAPYGKAADETIQLLALENIRDKLVMGENISQAFHLVASGSAEVGFIALSQLKNPDSSYNRSYWLVPESYHQPIEQQLVVINKNDAAEVFVRFLISPVAIKIITDFGYQTDIPDIN